MAVEVALAVVVLLVAGTFFRSFMATRNMDPGFTRDGVLLAAYDLSGQQRDEGLTRQFASRLLTRLRGLPAVSGAAIASAVPLDIHGLPVRFFSVEGRPRNDNAPDRALAMTVTPGYFAVMGMPLLSGTDFADLDDRAAPPQVVVNEELVRRFLDRREPLGRRVEARGRSFVIAGVVRNSLYNAFGEPPTPIVYFSYRDRPSAIGEIHLRPRAGSETALAPDVRRVVSELDPELPVYDSPDAERSHRVEPDLPAHSRPHVRRPRAAAAGAGGDRHLCGRGVHDRAAHEGDRRSPCARRDRQTRGRAAHRREPDGRGLWRADWLDGGVLFRDAQLRAVPSTGSSSARYPRLLLVVATLACWIPARRAARVDPVVALRQE